MSSREDDQVTAALKQELVAFLFNEAGPRMAPRSNVADIVAEIVADSVNDQINRQMNELRKSVVANLRRDETPPLARILSNPLFLAVAAVAILSLGANIGLGVALLAKPAAGSPPDTVEQVEASASASCLAITAESSSSTAKSGEKGKGKSGASASPESDASKVPNC